MPTRSGDLAVETHGIAPVPASNRYGTARRLFTVWFAPQMNMTVIFTGSVAVAQWLHGLRPAAYAKRSAGETPAERFA